MAYAPRVTVLMPVHNGMPFLHEALQSIFTQTYGDFEFLVIDDASTDESRSMLKSINDDRLRIVINETKQGITRTLNRGLELARGEYVARMDSDDISHPERLARQVEYLDTHTDITVVGAWANYLSGDGRDLGVCRMPTESSEIRHALLKENCFFHPSVVFRRETIVGLGGYDDALPHAQDYDLWLRVADHHNLANLPLPLLSYRVHVGQASLTKLGVQREIADRCRREAASRRLAAGEAVPTSLYRTGLWAHLTAAPSTLGADYLKWAAFYDEMGHRDLADKLAAPAVAASPFAAAAWKRYARAVSYRAVPARHRSALRWYLARFMRLGRWR